MKRYLKLFWLLLKFKINRQMIYSFNFYSVFFADMSLYIVQLITFSVIFGAVESVNGWYFHQMIVFIGTFSIIDSLNMSTFFFGLLSLPDKIRTGKLDLYIVKPINTLFFCSFDNMNPGSLLSTSSGILIVIYGLNKGNVQITPAKVIGYIFLILMMELLFYDLLLLFRLSAFWFIRINSIMEAEDSLIQFCFRIPGIVFKGFSKALFYVLIPYGIIATIPAQFITDSLSLSYWLLCLSVVTFFTLLTFTLFTIGRRRYTSASS